MCGIFSGAKRKGERQKSRSKISHNTTIVNHSWQHIFYELRNIEENCGICSRDIKENIIYFLLLKKSLYFCFNYALVMAFRPMASRY